MPAHSSSDVGTRQEERPSAQEGAGEEYAFRQRVGLLANALDDIRYEDGVEYTHSDMARLLTEVDEEFGDVYRQLEENRERFEENYETYQEIQDTYTQLAAQDELPDEAAALVDRLGTYVEQEGVRMESEEERILQDRRLREKYREIQDYFDDIKYNGESESGPGAFIVLVDGPAEEFAAYADEKKEGTRDAQEDGTEWGSRGIDPMWDDEKLAQLIYETMERNDGAIIVGDDGFLPKTYWVPDTAAPEEAYVDGGTKHDAAVNAVYSEEIDAESLVLSETDGAIRWFRKHETPVKFAYDNEEQQQVPKEDSEFWY